jgi:hypothetical protein
MFFGSEAIFLPARETRKRTILPTEAVAIS